MIYITIYPLTQRINPMRKLLLTTAAVAAAIAGAVAGETAFGTFTDTRDGQTYKTVKIGKQTWMAQNINYKTPSGSWCYDNADSNCVKYGRLYDWNAAMTACPAGYHLASQKDWENLGNTVGGKMRVYHPPMEDWVGAGISLKAKHGWNSCKNQCGNGTDNFGFSALPGGNRDSIGNFNGAGSYGRWWANTRLYDFGVGKGGVWWIDCTERHNCDVVTFYYGHADAVEQDGGFSVRCVADRP